MPRLSVQNAEIKTASVEVRTLTLSGKQVTLSVFKQIQREHLVDEAGEIAGEPWGVVNYHPDKCEEGRKHLHVVWQKGDELRRAAIYPDASLGLAQVPGKDLIESAVADGLQFDVSPDRHYPALEALGRVSAKSTGLFDPGDTAHFAIFDYEGIRYRVAISEETRRIGTGSIPSPTPRHQIRQFDDLLEQISSIGRVYRTTYGELASLPQLFIAV